LLALVNGRPQTLSLKQALQHFIDFRREVVVRRATYDLAQAEARAHLLEGFAIALEHLDEVIAIIRGAEETRAARMAVMARFDRSRRRPTPFFEMRRVPLPAMGRQRVLEELAGVRALSEDLKPPLDSAERTGGVVVEELAATREKYGDDRRTELGPP